MNISASKWICILLSSIAFGCENKENKESAKEESSSVKSKSKSRSEVSRGNRPAQLDSPESQQLRIDLTSELDSAKLLVSFEERERAIADVAWRSLETLPELAQQAILELSTENSDKVPLLQILVQNMAIKDPDVALALARSLENETERALALEQVSTVIRERDPKRAMELLPNLGDNDGDLSPAAEPVLRSWASADPQAALRWLSRRASGDEQKTGFKTVFDQWLSREPEEAFKWASLQTDSDVRHAAIRAITRSVEEWLEDSQQALLKQVPAGLRQEIEEEREKLAQEKELTRQRLEEEFQSEMERQELLPEQELEQRE